MRRTLIFLMGYFVPLTPFIYAFHGNLIIGLGHTIIGLLLALLINKYEKK